MGTYLPHLFSGDRLWKPDFFRDILGLLFLLTDRLRILCFLGTDLPSFFRGQTYSHILLRDILTKKNFQEQTLLPFFSGTYLPKRFFWGHTCSLLFSGGHTWITFFIWGQTLDTVFFQGQTLDTVLS